jgi:hypothetical protein
MVQNRLTKIKSGPREQPVQYWVCEDLVSTGERTWAHEEIISRE